MRQTRDTGKWVLYPLGALLAYNQLHLASNSLPAVTGAIRKEGREVGLTCIFALQHCAFSDRRPQADSLYRRGLLLVCFGRPSCHRGSVSLGPLVHILKNQALGCLITTIIIEDS